MSSSGLGTIPGPFSSSSIKSHNTHSSVVEEFNAHNYVVNPLSTALMRDLQGQGVAGLKFLVDRRSPTIVLINSLAPAPTAFTTATDFHGGLL